ncbi:MAG TPA: DegT/DnrJ/EryC1/StrS family aminotransferase [Bacteriovoracaceae bacterium]|nr:DegT/DnrJ/EryC1/StrS family aminotransferase [Bacteriovoracaceae bacterium]
MYDIGKEELSALENLFKTRKFFRYQGPNVPTLSTELESRFSEYLGMKHSLLLTSGTNALILALRSLGIEKGDEVLVPSYTFVATIAAVIAVGATPVICSVGNGLTLDPDSLENKVNEKTKAIIPVHMDGLPANMDGILAIAKKHNLIIIEDVAQAIGGSYKGQKLGGLADAGCFSFNVDKIISCGEGGLVSFASEVPYRKALMLHDIPNSFGMTLKDYLSSIPYEVGYSMRISEISAAILTEQFKRLDGIIHQLRTNKKLLLEGLQALNGQIIFSDDPAGDCSTHLHIKVSDPLMASEVSRKLTEKGILTTPLYARPAHCYWHWQHLLGERDLPTKDRIHLSSIIRMAIPYDVEAKVIREMTSNIVEVLLG